MDYQSRAIDSNQQGVHEDLENQVRKYLQTRFRKPVAEHSQEAFDRVQEEITQWQGPVVLDSCCGVGESTLHLAREHTDALVIGVDKSAHRLAKNAAYQKGDMGQRCLLVRADLNDFWRLAVEADWPLTHHYILYPNPWPKHKHLGRRWHGGALFPQILALGGKLEVRSNWRLYVEEFQQALNIACQQSVVKQLPAVHAPITPFERKYQATEQPLWQLQSNLC